LGKSLTSTTCRTTCSTTLIPRGEVRHCLCLELDLLPQHLNCLLLVRQSRLILHHIYHAIKRRSKDYHQLLLMLTKGGAGLTFGDWIGLASNYEDISHRGRVHRKDQDHHQQPPLPGASITTTTTSSTSSSSVVSMGPWFPLNVKSCSSRLHRKGEVQKVIRQCNTCSW